MKTRVVFDVKPLGVSQADGMTSFRRLANVVGASRQEPVKREE